MQQRRIILIVGVILAIAAMFLVKVYLDEQSKKARQQAFREAKAAQKRQTSVVIAKEDIPKGAEIETKMLELKTVPRNFIQPKAATSPERITGLVALAPISKGEQVTLSKLLSPTQARGGSLAMATPVGKRAITIPVDSISSLLGMVRPGDYVDVVGLVPIPVQDPSGKQVTQMAVMPLFQNVLVLTVGRQMGRLASTASSRRGEKTETKVTPAVTLALTAHEASLLTFVREQGKISLILRSPADSRVEPVQPAGWDTLFQYIMPQAMKAAEVKEEEDLVPPVPQKKPRAVEIYRGLSKETMHVSE